MRRTNPNWVRSARRFGGDNWQQSPSRQPFAPFGRGAEIGFVRPESRDSLLGVGAEIGFVWPKSRGSRRLVISGLPKSGWGDETSPPHMIRGRRLPISEFRESPPEFGFFTRGAGVPRGSAGSASAGGPPAARRAPPDLKRRTHRKRARKLIRWRAGRGGHLRPRSPNPIPPGRAPRGIGPFSSMPRRPAISWLRRRIQGLVTTPGRTGRRERSRCIPRSTPRLAVEAVVARRN